MVDRVQYLIASVTASPPVKTGDDDPVRAGQEAAPVQPETIVDALTAGPRVPARDRDGIISSFAYLRWLGEFSGHPRVIHVSIYLHTDEKRIFF